MNAEEIRRLAHAFLTLRAEEAEIAALHTEVENNPAAALELLAQMRAVQGSVTPVALGAEQSEDIRQRVEALIAAGARKRGWLGFFRRRPSVREASKPLPAPKAPGAALPPLVFSGVPRQEIQVGTDMEDTAPIAEVPAAPEKPAAPASMSPSPAVAAAAKPPRARSALSPPPSELEPPQAAAAPLPQRARPGRRSRILVPAALLLALAAYVLFSRRGSSAAGQAAPTAPTVVAPALPTQSGPPARADIQAGAGDAPLPAELPRSTPVQSP
jgi:hypothetical protein